MSERVEHTRPNSAPCAALFVAGVSALAGCAGAGATSSLGKAVLEMAPDYRFKAPVSSDADLGRELRDGHPLTNACFDGARGQHPPAAGLRALSATYEEAFGAQLRADFGRVLSLPASASARTSSRDRATVTLTDLKVETLDGVFLNPKSACATDAATRAAFESPGGTLARVITRAIKAGTVDVSADASIARQLSVVVSAAGGGGTASERRSGSISVSGANLYVADYSECFKVTHRVKTCPSQPIGPGGACDVATCVFQVNTYDPATSKIEGVISCQGEDAPSTIVAALGTYAGERTAPGVSYTVRVTRGQGLGAVDIELHLWTVLSVAPDACR